MSKTKPEKKEKEVIPNMELVLIFIFFASFLFWAISKCNATKDKYEQNTAKEEAVEKIDSLALKPKPKKTSLATKTSKKGKKQVVLKEVSMLYVVLDGLKLRKGPTRDSAFTRELKLNEKVYFLDEVTDFKESINLGHRVANEPWVRVRAKSGHEGWVYGGGVSYYRQKPEKIEVLE